MIDKLYVLKLEKCIFAAEVYNNLIYLMKYFFVYILSLFVITCYAQTAKVEKDGFKWQPYAEYGRYGAKTVDGQVIIPAKFNTCYYERGHFTVKNDLGKIGIISRNGKVLVPVGEYNIVSEFQGYKGQSPFIVVGLNGFGTYTSDGTFIIPAQYRYINPFVTSKGIFYVVTNNNSLSGVVDEKGKWIIKPTKYNLISTYDVGGTVYFACLEYGENRCSDICDIQGKLLKHTKYTLIEPEFNTNGELQYKIYHGFSYGIMSQDGKVIQAPSSETIYKPTMIKGKRGYIVIDKNYMWGFADNQKKMIVPCAYDYVEIYDSYIQVRKGRYMGLFDECGKPVISTDKKYIATVKLDEKPLASYISAITEENKQAIFDLRGHQISGAKHQRAYMYLSNNKDTMIMFQDHGMFGIEDLKHKEIIPARYQHIKFLEKEDGLYYVVAQNNLFGLCDPTGKEIIGTDNTDIFYRKYKNKEFYQTSNGDYTAIYNLDGTQLINGESFKRIVYDESSSQFIAYNGNRKCYFSKDGILISDNSLDIMQDKYISFADEYFERGKYKLAAKNYELAINVKPSATLYFNRGVSYYNLGKYNDAMVDFRSCLNNNPSQRLKNRSYELMDKAENFQYQKEQRRQETISAIFGLVLTGANMYFEVQAQKQKAKYSSNSKYASSSLTYDDEVDDLSIGSNSGTSNKNCPSLKIHNGKWYCNNTGECGMCGGDGLMDGMFGQGPNSHKCTLCGGTGKCKYCQ